MALSTGLLAYYKLDSNSNDSLGTYNGTDTSVSYVAGKISNAASYNGTTSKTNLSLSLNPTAELTIAGWINTSSSSRQGIFVNSNGASNIGTAWGCEVNTTAGKLTFNLATGASGSGITSTGSLSTSTWYHVAFVYNGTTRYIYINGALDTSGAYSGALNVPNTGNTIGGYGSYGGGLLFSGLIDEVGYWSRGLTGSEITQLYNSGNGMTYPFTNNNGSGFMALRYPSVKNHLISNKPMINFVAMGDSNTYGHLITPVTDRFSNLFGLNLGVVSQNIGVSGYTIPDLISTASTALYPKYVSGKRNCVTILIGINDFVGGASAATAWTNLQTLIADIKANGWEVYVITYFPYGGHPTETAKIVTFNSSIVANAVSLGYSVIDAYTAFHDGSGGNLPGYVQADGAHLTNLGNSIINNLIYPVVY